MPTFKDICNKRCPYCYPWQKIVNVAWIVFFLNQDKKFHVPGSIGCFDHYLFTIYIPTSNKENTSKGLTWQVNIWLVQHLAKFTLAGLIKDMTCVKWINIQQIFRGHENFWKFVAISIDKVLLWSGVLDKPSSLNMKQFVLNHFGFRSWLNIKLMCICTRTRQ